jgi:hypothetical protein
VFALDGNLSMILPKPEEMATEKLLSGLEQLSGSQLLSLVSMLTSVSNKIRTLVLQ